jgi:hypothetical protein
MEAAESWQKTALRHQAETPRSTLADRVTRYEAEATQLGAIPLETRASEPQASGDSVRPARGRGVEHRSRGRAATVVTERTQAEVAAEDQHAALRADVLLAVAAGHDLAS